MMVRIGGAVLSPRRCNVAASFWTRQTETTIKTLAESGLDVAEIRLDLAGAGTESEARRLCESFSGMPTILTLRAAYEGGGWQGDDLSRGGRILSLLPFCDAVDIELAAEAILPDIVAACRAQGKTIIVSRHNFAATDTAATLNNAMSAAFAAGADIFKCASLCVKASDFEVLAAFATQSCRQDRCCVVIGMDDGSNNEHARRARRELPRLGSCLAFAAIDGGSAPGQLSLAETVTICNDNSNFA